MVTRPTECKEEEIGGFPIHSFFVKLLWASPRLGLRANFRGQINWDIPPVCGATPQSCTNQPGYDVWYAQVSKRFAGLGAYALSAYAQVDNIFDENDVYRRNAQGAPITTELMAIWLAPRSFLVGITIDTDWTK